MCYLVPLPLSISHFPSFVPLWGISAPFHSSVTVRSLFFMSSHLDQSFVLLVQWVEKHFLKPSEMIKHWREAKKCVIRMLQFLLRPFGSCVGKDNFQHMMPRSLWGRVAKRIIQCQHRLYHRRNNKKIISVPTSLHSSPLDWVAGQRQKLLSSVLGQLIIYWKNESPLSSQAGKMLLLHFRLCTGSMQLIAECEFLLFF